MKRFVVVLLMLVVGSMFYTEQAEARRFKRPMKRRAVKQKMRIGQGIRSGQLIDQRHVN